MQRMPQSICAYVCAYVYFGPNAPSPARGVMDHCTPPNVWHLAVTFSKFIRNICQCTWARYGASSIPAERFDVILTGWHMFRHDNYEAGRASWRSYPTYLPDTEPAPSQLKYLMLNQLVNTCLHLISMKLQNHPGGLIPPICQIQNQLHHSWNI